MKAAAATAMKIPSVNQSLLIQEEQVCSKDNAASRDLTSQRGRCDRGGFQSFLDKLYECERVTSHKDTRMPYSGWGARLDAVAFYIPKELSANAQQSLVTSGITRCHACSINSTGKDKPNWNLPGWICLHKPLA